MTTNRSFIVSSNPEREAEIKAEIARLEEMKQALGNEYAGADKAGKNRISRSIHQIEALQAEQKSQMPKWVVVEDLAVEQILEKLAGEIDYEAEYLEVKVLETIKKDGIAHTIKWHSDDIQKSQTRLDTLINVNRIIWHNAAETGGCNLADVKDAFDTMIKAAKRSLTTIRCSQSTNPFSNALDLADLEEKARWADDEGWNMPSSSYRDLRNIISIAEAYGKTEVE